MGKKNVTFEVNIKNSEAKLILMVGDNLFKMSKTIQLKHKRKELLIPKKKAKEMGGCVINTFKEDNLIYVVVERKKGIIPMSTLTHELFHATGSVMRKIDFNYYEDEEIYANLNGALNSSAMLKLIDLNEKFSYIKHKDIKIVND